MQKGYKTELKPNNKQKTLLERCCGVSRFAYNWGLERRIKEYEETKKSTSAMEQHREINQLKKDELNWMYEYSKCIPQEALRDLEVAFRNFFRNIKQGKKPGFPKFKSRKKGIGSFRLTGVIKVEENRVKLPRIGWISLKEHNYLPVGKPSSITVSEKAGHWFVSFHVKEKDKKEELSEEIIGIDLGLKELATLSNGEVIENPRSLKKGLKKLKKVQNFLSRKVKGSKNRKKAKKKVQRTHYKISNIRRDFIHKATTKIARTKPKCVVLEDLNVSGMVKNRKLSRSISDASWNEFRRQLEYKLKWIGSKLVFADRFYPSSKTCSKCGKVKSELKLSERIFKCDCGFEIDRDLNAAINLKNLAVSSTVLACGEILRPKVA
ncbi:transposase [Candidatus Pacearchaeota archaeon]|nr:transposase [Candidatus Pacearchaeota archaeon]